MINNGSIGIFVQKEHLLTFSKILTQTHIHSSIFGTVWRKLTCTTSAHVGKRAIFHFWDLEIILNFFLTSIGCWKVTCSVSRPEVRQSHLCTPGAPRGSQESYTHRNGKGGCQAEGGALLSASGQTVLEKGKCWSQDVEGAWGRDDLRNYFRWANQWTQQHVVFLSLLQNDSSSHWVEDLLIDSEWHA